MPSPPPAEAAEAAAAPEAADLATAPEAAAPAAAPPSPPEAILEVDDLVNTRWDVKATPRESSWLKGGVRDQEFTLLADGKVYWGGDAGGFGTGGRWTLKDGMLEVIRTTPLGLVTGRDYYMASAQVEVNDQLQFELGGIIRSYNALYPVMVIADFNAKRRPGRFVMDTGDDDDEKQD